MSAWRWFPEDITGEVKQEDVSETTAVGDVEVQQENDPVPEVTNSDVSGFDLIFSHFVNKDPMTSMRDPIFFQI